MYVGGSWAAIAGDTRSEEKSGSSSVGLGGSKVAIEGIVCDVLVGESIEMEGMGEIGETIWFGVERGSVSVVLLFAAASMEMEGVETASWFALGIDSLSAAFALGAASEESIEMDGVEKAAPFVVARGSCCVVLAAGAKAVAEVVVGYSISGTGKTVWFIFGSGVPLVREFDVPFVRGASVVTIVKRVYACGMKNRVRWS